MITGRVTHQMLCFLKVAGALCLEAVKSPQGMASQESSIVAKHVGAWTTFNGNKVQGSKSGSGSSLDDSLTQPPKLPGAWSLTRTLAIEYQVE